MGRLVRLSWCASVHKRSSCCARAVAEDCDVFHLDSGVQLKRAHQFYLREGLELASYHFSERLKPQS